MKFSIFCIIIFLLISSTIASEWPKLTIGTYSSPPYQYIEKNIITGESVYTVQCIFHKLKREAIFDFYPLKRALHELKSNNIDGVFPVHSPDTARHSHTAPISIEKWYWLTNFPMNENPVIPDDKKIGAVNGSPAYFWLLENNYRIDTIVTTKAQLLQMFKVGRLDAIIIDDNDTNRDIEFHKSIEYVLPYWSFIKFEPHLLVFSNDSLLNYPNLLIEFNEKISACKPVSLEVSNSEKRMLQEYLKTYMVQLSNFLHSHSPLPRLKDSFFEESEKEIDDRWVKEAINSEGTLYDFVIKSKLGTFLANLQEKSNGGISEILIMDSDGYAVALSQTTTDLYQGDEQKFFKTFPHGKNSAFVSDIIYDASTRTYQSQVSFCLSDEISPIGVVTFGVNVEKILLGNQSRAPMLLEDTPVITER